MSHRSSWARDLADVVRSRELGVPAGTTTLRCVGPRNTPLSCRPSPRDGWFFLVPGQLGSPYTFRDSSEPTRPVLQVPTTSEATAWPANCTTPDPLSSTPVYPANSDGHEGGAHSITVCETRLPRGMALADGLGAFLISTSACVPKRVCVSCKQKF